MNKFSIFAIIFSFTFFASCGGDKKTEQDASKPVTEETDAATPDPSSYDPNRGEGKYTTVELGASLDQAMATKGEEAAGVKCTSCHKMTEEKLVGPGWKGVTDRRTPEWIMNFVTNTEEMLQKDTAAQNMLEICLVKMPNQNLSETDARNTLEFMRKNDGKE